MTIAKTALLQTVLDDKQDEITTDTDLTLNSITTSGRVGFDTTNIQFNTLVVRRPTGNDRLILNEIQVWVNGANILFSNSGDLNGYFADWDTDKDAEIPPLTFLGIERGVDRVYNNILENNNDFGTHSDGNDANALIIKNIPLTNINDIQSIVYYNRFGEDRSIGLVLELYNSTNDAGLIYPLASSNVITTYQLRYRYDFPSITSYSGFADGNSIDDIVNDTIALTETIRLSNIEMTGNVDISGGLNVDTITLPIIGDVKTSIQGNTDNILTNTNNLSGVQTQVDALINFTGGGVNFRAYSLSSVTINAGNNLTYDNDDYDTENSYDTTNAVYTIVIGGTYVFSFGWYVISGSTAVINLIRKRNSVETILQQSTNGTNTSNNSGFFSTTIAECQTGDEIFAYLDSGSCSLIPFNTADPDTFTSFSGSRISN